MIGQLKTLRLQVNIVRHCDNKPSSAGRDKKQTTGNVKHWNYTSLNYGIIILWDHVKKIINNWVKYNRFYFILLTYFYFKGPHICTECIMCGYIFFFQWGFWQWCLVQFQFPSLTRPTASTIWQNSGEVWCQSWWWKPFQ